MSKQVMAWLECTGEIGKTGAGDVMATILTNVGAIEDKSCSLETSDGETMEKKTVGGKIFAKETSEGGYMLKMRIIEPTDELMTLLGLGEVVIADGVDKNDFQVKTHRVDGDWSVKITPLKVGAKGIKAPKCNITCKPGWSDTDGNFLNLEIEILHGAAGYWYSRFTNNAE